MPFFTFLLTYLVTFLITELLRPKPNIENAKPAALGDFQVPTATEGRAVPIIWGRVLLKGPNVVWYGDLRADPITERVRTGLFSKKTVTTGFMYYIGMQLALCRGPFGSNDNLRNIRIDDSFAWGIDAPTADTPVSPASPAGSVVSINVPEFLGGDDAGGTGGIVGTLRLYPGDEAQTTAPYLGPFQSPLPAYRGTVYGVWEQGWIGNAPRLTPWSFEVQRYPDGLDLENLQPGDEIVANGANPMNVIFEVLTNSEWGLNINPASVNVASFRTSAATLATEGNGFAWVWDRELDLLEVIRTVEEQIDGVLFVDPTTGNYDVTLIRFDYTPGTLPLLDESNVVQLNRFGRPAWAATSNIIKAQFSDERKNYETSFALAQDMANVEIVQASNLATVNFPGVKASALANDLAWRELRQQSRPIGQGQLVSDRSQWDLKPGDVRELTWGRLGFVRLPIRIIKVNRGDILNNKITIDFTEDIFAVQAGSFTDPIDTGWVPPPDSAQVPLFERLIEIPYRITDSGEGANTTQLQIGTLVVRDGGLHTSYNTYATFVDLPGTPADPTEEDVIPPGGSSQFTPFGQLTAALDRGETNGFVDAVGFTIDNTVDASRLMNAGPTQLEARQNVLVVNQEIMLFETVIDNGNGTFTIQDVYRGSLDTLPQAHADNSDVFFLSYGIGVVNETPISDGTTGWKARNQTLTPFNTLPFASSVVQQIQADNRASKPYPPRDVTVNPAAPGGGNFPVDAGSPSGAELVGTLQIRWAGSDKFTQAFATAWDDAHVTQEAGSSFRVRIIEDPAGTAIVKSDIAGIPAGSTEGAFNAQGFADDTVTDQYGFDIRSLNANGESQIWSVGPFSIYGYGYKYDEKYGGDNDGAIVEKGDPPPVVDPVPGVSSESVVRLTASGVIGSPSDTFFVQISFLQLGTVISQNEAYTITGVGKSIPRDYLIDLADQISADFDPLLVNVNLLGDVLTVSSFFGNLGGSVRNNTAGTRIDQVQDPNPVGTNGRQQVIHFDLWEGDGSTNPVTEVLAPNVAETYNINGNGRGTLNLTVGGRTLETAAGLPIGGSNFIGLQWGGRVVSPGTQAIDRFIPLRNGLPGGGGARSSDLYNQFLDLAEFIWPDYIANVQWQNWTPVPIAPGNEAQDRVGVEIVMKDNYTLSTNAPFWETANQNTPFTGEISGIKLLGKYVIRGTPSYPDGSTQVVRVSFATEYSEGAVELSPVVAGQIYSITLGNDTFTEIATGGDAADSPYRDGIYSRLETQINASGTYSVIGTRTLLREPGGATFVVSIDIQHDTINTPFTFDANGNFGTDIDVEVFTQ